tara:strand:+ start:251 stop:580 length:330 start_codon:yes stop_codon:yes gene_type:complete
MAREIMESSIHIRTITKIAELKEKHINLVHAGNYEEATKVRDEINILEENLTKELDRNIGKINDIVKAADAFVNSVLNQDAPGFPGIEAMVDLRKDLKEIKLTINKGKS